MLRTLVAAAVLISCVSPVDAAPKRRADAATRNRIRETRGNSAHTLHAQVLLDRAGFSVGEIDGQAGANFRRALLGYQKQNGLPTTGTLDGATWNSLTTKDAAPALVAHVVTKEDVAGPFEPNIPEDMMELAKLKAAAYQNAEEELGERFHVSPALLTKLNAGKVIADVGAEIQVPNVRQANTAKAGSIVVSKSDSTVTALDGAGNILVQYPATIGSEHDPLPIGDWTVTGVSHYPKFHYNPELFWDADPTHSKAIIPPGPNNPVGSVWIGLTKEHYGIHGTPKPGTVGHTESHGCIRLTNWDAQELAGMVAKGAQVHMVE
jgi:lipoprotein-anchoring transpeptidase ErfK/SrfK